MPTYAKFMKDIISKRCTADTNPIILTKTCSAILQGMKIPIKKKDRGAVTIPCTIGDRSFNKDLIDLGASVSLMSLSIYKKLEMPEDEEIPLILGRPFLETGRCVLNIEEGTMTLKVLDQVMTYDSPLNAPQSPLERVLRLSIFDSDKEVDNGESEVLAFLDAQPPWKGSRPHWWEGL
ncbi:hypothetical protein KIW84_075745 [Lathyrus oleraceus]|uniref:Aspartic peptidase DDI1-type domain-containing protein n=1 Tax=Pisum sativum TaxID=3888 RepID=A0A9D4VUS5_PEA|nr:hypothetical protein KIW84_075745 [Pisum sativum]